MENFNIKIVGIGEGGARAVGKMISAGLDKKNPVEFVAIGNDENIMLSSPAKKNIFLNRDLTTVYKSISDALHGSKIIFIVAGLGSNAARASIPIITACAKNFNALTVAFVCKPFILENITRKINSDYNFANLQGKVDTLFVLPTEKFLTFRMNQSEISLDELFDVADDIFCRGIEIFLKMLSTADNDTPLALLRWGNAAFGYGTGKTALEAVKSAVKFPTIDENDLKNTDGMFLSFSSSKILQLNALEAANKFIKSKIPPDSVFFSHEDKDISLGNKIFAAIIMTRKNSK